MSIFAYFQKNDRHFFFQELMTHVCVCLCVCVCVCSIRWREREGGGQERVKGGEQIRTELNRHHDIWVP